MLAPWDLYQSKAHPRLPNTSQYKFPPPFGRKYNGKLRQPNRAPDFGEFGACIGVEEGTKRIADLTFQFDVCAHHRPILHRLATIDVGSTEKEGRSS